MNRSRKSLSTSRTLLATLITATILLLSWGLAQSPDANTMIVRYRGDIRTLDPQFHSSLHDYGVADNIYCQLIRLRPGSAEIVPDLAESWDISDDGLVYTFHLRQGAQWHKGYGEVTSADVKWAYDRLLDPEAGSPGHFAFNVIDRIETPDPYTVRLVLSEPHGPLLTKLAYNRHTGIINPEARQRFADDYNSNAVGCGPYELAAWVPGERIELVAFEDYYEEGLPVTQRIVLVPIADDAIAAGAMEAGELVLGLFRDPNAVARLEANPDLVVDRTSQSAISALYYDTREPPFNDPRVRQAIHHAIDRPEMVAQVLTGVATEALSFIVPLAPGSTTDVAVYEYDPQRARELLAEAGYPDGFSVDLLSTQLEPWPLVAPIVQFYLEDVGIDVNLRQLEHGTYGAERAQGNYDMVVLTVTGPPDPDTWMGLVHSSNVPPGNNHSYYSNPEVDALIDEARATTDQAVRAELYVQIQQMVLEDAGLMPLYHLGVQAIRHKSVHGFVTPIAHDFKLKSAYVDEEDD